MPASLRPEVLRLTGNQRYSRTFYVYHRCFRFDYRYEVYRERDHVLCINAETTQLFIDSHGESMIDKSDYFVGWQQNI